jgi:hypothetical protein
MSIERRGSFKPKKRNEARSLRHILVDKGECISASHADLKALHILGHNRLQPKFLPDGTMLTDLGGVTCVMMPDGRLGAVFSPNPKNIMPLNGKTESPFVPDAEINYPKLRTAEGLTVLDMRVKPDDGLDPDWVSEASHKFDALMTDSFTDFGLLIRVDENRWRNQAVEYEITEPSKKKHRKNVIGNNPQSILKCRYGMSIDAIQETKGNKNVSLIAKAHRAISRVLHTDWASFDAEQSQDVMTKHFGGIANKVQQGFNPHKVTFSEGNESDFSEKILGRSSNKTRLDKAKSKAIFFMAGATSTVLTMVSTLASGLANTSSDYSKKNARGAVTKLATTAITKRAITVGGGATLVASNFILRSMNTAILQTSKWLNLNKENIGHTAYKHREDPKVRKRVFQEADPEQLENAMTLSLEEYDVSAGPSSQVRHIPKQYILNRLFNTKAIGDGAVMEGFDVQGQELTHYRERSGIERTRLPHSDIVYVTAVNANKDEDWGLMDQTKEYLESTDVLKVWKDKKGKLRAKSITFQEYEDDLIKVTQSTPKNPVLAHPDAKAFQEGWDKAAAKQERLRTEAEIVKYKERAAAPHRQVILNL